MNLIVALIFAMAPLNQSTTDLKKNTITIEISNLKNTKGQICVLVFNGKSGYPEDFNKAHKSKIFPVTGNTTTVKMEDIISGDYVLTVLHDENGNRIMDKNIFGVPLEGYGVSNNPKPNRFGPPDYTKGIIHVKNKNQTIGISLRY